MRRRGRLNRALLRDRLRFLFTGVIPGYSVRANRGVSLAWLNVLAAKGEPLRSSAFMGFTEEEMKTVERFLMTNHIGSRKRDSERFFERHRRGNSQGVDYLD